MKDLTHTVLHEGRIVTYSWLGDANVPVARVRALPFIPDGRMLLVSGAPSDPCCYPPGGGVEAFDETPEAALRRELMEEAAATIHALKRLGVQRRYDPAVGTEYSALVSHHARRRVRPDGTRADPGVSGGLPRYPVLGPLGPYGRDFSREGAGVRTAVRAGYVIGVVNPTGAGN